MAVAGGPSGGGSQVDDANLQAELRERQQPAGGAAPLISPNNVINVNPGNNSLIITDYADNLQRIARIIAASDVVQWHRRRSHHLCSTPSHPTWRPWCCA